jgi:UDP-N-acetyl-D-glucosamine/UDP-N-acetyl-D-galactosamine dehydrogenase
MYSDFKITVVGLGYVGLPLALEFGKKYSTIGFDIDEKRIKQLNRFKDRNNESSYSDFKASKKIKFFSNFDKTEKSQIYIITVPTPVKKNNTPDLSLVINACKLVAKKITKKDIVVFESTVYPGATEEVFIPVIEKISYLKGGKDFQYGYSPERINPGDKEKKLSNILKIVSGSNLRTAAFLKKLYGSIIKAGIYTAESIKIAEAAKVIENTQRDLNIALINEFALIFDRLNIDTYKILDAANTKWNFLNFKPGLVGGHCIGVDPYYLTYKSKKEGYDPKVILAGRKINNYIPNYIAKKINNKLKKIFKVKKLNILIMGFTFKENCSDIRNTKVENIMNKLIKLNYKVDIFDNYANEIEFNKKYKKKLISNFKKVKKNFYHAIIIAVKHKEFRKTKIQIIKSFGVNKALIYDLKNIFPENNEILKF